jgi:hypothetical protein
MELKNSSQEKIGVVEFINVFRDLLDDNYLLLSLKLISGKVTSKSYIQFSNTYSIKIHSIEEISSYDDFNVSISINQFEGKPEFKIIKFREQLLNIYIKWDENDR